jgi:putative FmdB family regulatory protein
MPIYEYECPHCGHEFDKFVNHLRNGNKWKCPKCGKQANKVISPNSFILKGGGWAKDNYSSKKG